MGLRYPFHTCSPRYMAAWAIVKINISEDLLGISLLVEIVLSVRLSRSFVIVICLSRFDTPLNSEIISDHRHIKSLGGFTIVCRLSGTITSPSGS